MASLAKLWRGYRGGISREVASSRISPRRVSPFFIFIDTCIDIQQLKAWPAIGQIVRFPVHQHINFLPSLSLWWRHFILLDVRLLNFNIIFDREAVDIPILLRLRPANGLLIVFLGMKSSSRNLVVCRDEVVVGVISARLS